jgi:O-methyltransferase
MPWKNDQVSEIETEKIIELARNQLSCQGDFVELGCYKGDTSLLLAEVLKGTEKKLWIYDSFEGLPEKSEADESALGMNFKGGELCVTKREVKERFLRAGLPVPVIKKAWFSELTGKDLPEEVALAFLDGDFYESIRDSLKLVESKMAEGGIIVVHDYQNPALPGVVKAVEEWAREQNKTIKTYQSMAIINS